MLLVYKIRLEKINIKNCKNCKTKTSGLKVVPNYMAAILVFIKFPTKLNFYITLKSVSYLYLNLNINSNSHYVLNEPSYFYEISLARCFYLNLRSTNTSIN